MPTTKSEGFREQAMTNPREYVSPTEIIDWVRRDRLVFTPGSRYEYSNTDNIVVGLIAQQVTGQSYGHLLSTLVFRPAGLTQTTFPTRRISLPAPFIHGYDVEPGKQPQDVTALLSPSGAWASGAIVSTPADLGAFIRADLEGRVFGKAQRREQLRFVPGSSSPGGPGTNSAGLAIFRYKTRCGSGTGNAHRRSAAHNPSQRRTPRRHRGGHIRAPTCTGGLPPKLETPPNLARFGSHAGARSWAIPQAPDMRAPFRGSLRSAPTGRP